MPGTRTEYPRFSEALYGLQQVMGDVRGSLKDNASFTTTDLTAFDTLLAAVQAAAAYFPRHRSEP